MPALLPCLSLLSYLSDARPTLHQSRTLPNSTMSHVVPQFVLDTVP